MNPTNHRVLIIWSEEDQAFLASAPDLRGCVAHGETRKEAFHNLEGAIADWLESASQEGWDLVKPVTHQDSLRRVAERVAESEKAKAHEIARAVEAALKEALAIIVPQIEQAIKAQHALQPTVCGGGDDDAYEYLDPPAWREES